MTHHLDALKMGNKNRLEIARIRSALRCGEISLVDVLRERPEELQHHFIIEILLMAQSSRSHRRGQSRSTMTAIGELAAGQKINLVVKLGEAPAETIEWVCAKVESAGRVFGRGQRERHRALPRP